MRKYIKKIIKILLKFFTKKILHKYQPDIIGVTGSFGKTSTKDAIYTVLADKYNVRRNVKNYNNEIGLPLTVIGASSGGRSAWNWMGVFIRALILLAWYDKDYPEILILEMGVDHPGDMKYLVDMVDCRIGIITAIGPVHLEFFNKIERIAKEKSILISSLKSNGWAMLNVDDERVKAMSDNTKARILTFGIENEADIRAIEINLSQDQQEIGQCGYEVKGLSFKLFYQGSTVPVFLPDIVGEHLIYSALVGASVGIIYNMNLVEISQALRKFQAPKGRMNLVDGIKRSVIIDDTYNSAPESAIAALKVLQRINSGGRRIAVLGDMLELGNYTVEAHQKVGQAVFDNGVDVLITYGERARSIAEGAISAGMNRENIFSFIDRDRAGRFLQDKMEQCDYVLVKGSQGMRMEKIVKEVMAEPLRAKDLLVRQERGWSYR